MCVLQATDFADRAASGALTVVVSAEVERLRAQHADVVREKSVADSKCRKLADKVAALEGERTDPGASWRRRGRRLMRPSPRRSLRRRRPIWRGRRAVLPGSAPRSWRSGSTLCRPVWRGLRLRRARRLSGHTNSLWIHTMSWARGSLTSKCRTESPDFAASSGYRRSCWRSPPSWRGLCPTPPWSPARGR
jgi:hypothetical protein